MSLYDVAVTSDSERLFAVGTVVQSSDGLQPSKFRNEKQIIGEYLSNVMDIESSAL
jgi:hypothetical protein